MDIQKGRILLNKIERLYQGLEDSEGNISSIERDLLLQYLRELYSDISIPSSITTAPAKPQLPIRETHTPIKKEPKVIISPPVFKEEKKEILPEKIAPTPPPVKKIVEPEPPKEEAIKIKKPEVIEKPVIQPVEKEEPVLPPPISKEEKVAPAAKVEKAYPILFEEEEASDLMNKLGQSPISNLKVAMSINDRFLMMKELFKGDAVAFDKWVEELNEIGSFEKAKDILCTKLIPLYHWDDEDAQKRAKEFIKLVRRRYA